MRKSTLSVPAFCLFISAISGCTHIQLQKDTVRQARTLSDIYEQQILDNLAKFVYDINSLPHFAVADGGTTAVNDQLSGTSSLILPKAAGSTLGVNGQRQYNDSWTLTPISDPHKLELMRCSYQRAVVCALHSGGQPEECMNCQQLINRFYTGRADTTPTSARAKMGQFGPCIMKLPAFDETQPIAPQGTRAAPAPSAKAAASAGGAPQHLPQDVADLSGVTAEDLNVGCRWFSVCCKNCIGRHRNRCCKVGEILRRVCRRRRQPWTRNAVAADTHYAQFCPV